MPLAARIVGAGVLDRPKALSVRELSEQSEDGGSTTSRNRKYPFQGRKKEAVSVADGLEKT